MRLHINRTHEKIALILTLLWRTSQTTYVIAWQNVQNIFSKTVTSSKRNKILEQKSSKEEPPPAKYATIKLEIPWVSHGVS